MVESAAGTVLRGSSGILRAHPSYSNMHLYGEDTRGVPNKPKEEARSANNTDKRKVGMGRDGQKSYPCEHYMKGCHVRGEQCRIDHSGDLETAPVCRDSLNGKCAKSRCDCRYRHISEAENYEGKAEAKKNRGWDH